MNPLARCAYLHAAGESVEEFETDLLLQILSLARQCGLRHAQPLSRAPVVLLFADRQEISQVPQFHINTLQVLIQS